MKKKIISIGIIAIFLLLCFSSSVVLGKDILEKKADTENSNGVYINPQCVGFSGSGYAFKSFWLKRSNTPYIMFCHYDSLEYGFILDKEGKRIDIETNNVIIVGFSFGQYIYSQGVGEYRQAYGNWFGFLEPSSFGGMMIDIQNPFYVLLF
jgi:hypothetical protein